MKIIILIILMIVVGLITSVIVEFLLKESTTKNLNISMYPEDMDAGKFILKITNKGKFDITDVEITTPKNDKCFISEFNYHSWKYSDGKMIYIGRIYGSNSEELRYNVFGSLPINEKTIIVTWENSYGKKFSMEKRIMMGY